MMKTPHATVLALGLVAFPGCLAAVEPEEVDLEDDPNQASESLAAGDIDGCLTAPGSYYDQQNQRFVVTGGSYDSGLGSLDPDKTTVLIAGRSVNAQLVAELRVQDSSRNYAFLYCENMTTEQFVSSLTWMEQQLGGKPDLTLLGLDAASFCDTPRRFSDVRASVQQTVLTLHGRGWRNLVVEMYPVMPHGIYDSQQNRWTEFAPAHYVCYEDGTIEAWARQAKAYNQHFRDLGWMTGDLWNPKGFFVTDGTHPHSWSVYHAARNAIEGLGILGL